MTIAVAMSGGVDSSTVAAVLAEKHSAIGLSPQQARSSIRFSLGRLNSEEDIELALSIVPTVAEQLRAVSPHYNRREAVSVQPSAVSKT